MAISSSAVEDDKSESPWPHLNVIFKCLKLLTNFVNLFACCVCQSLNRSPHILTLHLTSGNKLRYV